MGGRVNKGLGSTLQICQTFVMPTFGRMYVSWCFHLYCIYHANNSWEFMSVGVFIGDVFVMPTILGMYVSWCFYWYISCKHLGGCMSVGVFICIVYIMPTIHGNLCQLVFSLVLYILCPGDESHDVRWCFCWYFIYRANN